MHGAGHTDIQTSGVLNQCFAVNCTTRARVEPLDSPTACERLSYRTSRLAVDSCTGHRRKSCAGRWSQPRGGRAPSSRRRLNLCTLIGFGAARHATAPLYNPRPGLRTCEQPTPLGSPGPVKLSLLGFRSPDPILGRRPTGRLVLKHATAFRTVRCPVPATRKPGLTKTGYLAHCEHDKVLGQTHPCPWRGSEWYSTGT